MGEKDLSRVKWEWIYPMDYVKSVCGIRFRVGFNIRGANDQLQYKVYLLNADGSPLHDKNGKAPKVILSPSIVQRLRRAAMNRNSGNLRIRTSDLSLGSFIDPSTGETKYMIMVSRWPEA